MTAFMFGAVKVNAIPGAQCCGKPRGCTNTDRGCVYLEHPWKRATLFGDATVRCQAVAHDGGPRQCVLSHGHDGSHDLGGVA